MSAVVFLLGRPGSGKSQIARWIKGEESPAGNDSRDAFIADLKSSHITDYSFLMACCEQEEQAGIAPDQRKFAEDKHGGFAVKDGYFSVLEEALREVNKAVIGLLEAPYPSLILVELARDNYIHALQQFDEQILANAYFLCLHADIQTCINRVRERSRGKLWPDDNFVPKEIIKGYYRDEGFAQLCSHERFGKKTKIIQTDGEQEDIWVEVKDFVSLIGKSTLSLEAALAS